MGTILRMGSPQNGSQVNYSYCNPARTLTLGGPVLTLTLDIAVAVAVAVAVAAAVALTISLA